MKEEMALVAKTFQGLEDVLAEELTNLGASEVKPGRRMVAFRGDKAMLYKANFCCRTALRILKPIYTFRACDADELYEAVKKYDWEKLLSADQTFAIDSVVNSEEFRHSKFVTYRVKDAIADFFSEKYGKRPSIRLTNADVLLNVHILNDEVTISLDSSGESLHKRGYRVAQTEAPINEVLAAGLILRTGWKGDSNFVDPMCGSGTFLIEAALIAANINPGVFRQSFAFERWSDFDQELFDSIYNDDSQEREFDYKIYGSDVSPRAIAIAERNIKSAGVGKYIDLKVQPVQRIEEAPENGILVTNPPYGERIAADDMDALYESIGERLKNVFKGYHAWIIGYKSEYFDKIGLKPSVKIPVFNGALECEFREYVIFEGTFAEFRKQGRTIKDARQEEEKPSFRKDRERSRGDRERRGRWGDRDGQDRKSGWESRDRESRWGDRGRNDRDRKGRWEDRDRRNRRDNDRDSAARWEKRDRDDRWENRERRGRWEDRPRQSKPKNALEEKYHKPYSERLRSERRGGKPGDGQPQQEPVFADEKVQRAVRFRKPRLFEDEEKTEPAMRHRRKKDNPDETE